MRYKRIISAFLVVIMLSVFYPQSFAYATESKEFCGNRTVEFTFDSSDLDNYTNGGRARMDLYLRQSAPKWLSSTFKAEGRYVRLTYSFNFDTYDDYCEKIGVLLGYQPDILYKAGKDMVLVEAFETAQLLGSVQMALGESQTLSQWAKVTKNVLTVGDENYDFTGQKVSIYPENPSEILLKSLDINTSHKKGIIIRTISITLSADYTNHSQWKNLVRRCKQAGSVSQEQIGDTLYFSVTINASNMHWLIQLTDLCLDMPVSMSVRFLEVGEKRCTYLNTEIFLLTGYLEPDGSFRYDYVCPKDMKDITPISENTSLVIKEEGNTDTTGVNCIQSQSQFVKFSYSAPFRFDLINVQTEWTSIFKQIQRTITLSSPVYAAEAYHDTIKKKLSLNMPQGTILHIYDQDQTRHYVLNFSAWKWEDIEKFTAAFLETEIIHQNSWLPMGKSSYSEKIGDTNILNGFGQAHSVQVSYRFPKNVKIDEELLDNDSLTFMDTTESLNIQYRHINVIKLAILMLGLSIIIVVGALLLKKLKGISKLKVQKTKPNCETVFCTNCGAVMHKEVAFCSKCGAPVIDEANRDM